MTDKITNYDTRSVPLGTDRKVGRSEDGQAGVVNAPAPAPAEPVKITDQARLLAALEQTIASQPAVDEARVAEVRRSIEEGRYQVNAERIAEKLLRMEHDLGVK